MIGRMAGAAAAGWPAGVNHRPVLVVVFAASGAVVMFAVLTVQSWRYARRDRERAARAARRYQARQRWEGSPR